MSAFGISFTILKEKTDTFHQFHHSTRPKKSQVFYQNIPLVNKLLTSCNKKSFGVGKFTNSKALFYAILQMQN